MAGRVWVALFACMALAACSWAERGNSGAHAGPTASAFQSLNTAPLKLAQLATGQSCPESQLSKTDGILGAALGGGPVYLIGGQIVRSDPGHTQKVAWTADPTYVGPIRIRAARIDGSGQLLLGGPDNLWKGSPVKRVEGTNLYSELDFLESNTVSNPPSTWRVWPSAAYVSTSGCYAWQIDGLGFTEVITIQALQVPALAPGAPCPVSEQQVAHSLSAEFGTGPAVGAGPIYPLMGEMQEGVLKYSQSSSQSRNKDGWAYSKVLWMAKPGINGQVVIRGRQIDGPNAIRFGMNDSPDSLLKWDVGSQVGWGRLPSTTRIRAPGCYAYQVDGPTGSEVVVFQVVGVT